jgi:predicted enzyme related to lactoylglutathione lyase
MQVLKVLVPLRVPELDGAVGFYEQLTGSQVAARFPYENLEVAVVGQFVLFAGPEDALVPAEEWSAILHVDDLEAFCTWLAGEGGEAVTAVQPTPGGRRAVLRHPGGALFEYVQRDQA